MTTKTNKHFFGNSEGIHLMSVSSDNKFTLCGDPFDKLDENDRFGTLFISDTKTVTCQKCIEEIRNCKGVKTAKKPKEYLESNV